MSTKISGSTVSSTASFTSHFRGIFCRPDLWLIGWLVGWLVGWLIVQATRCAVMLSSKFRRRCLGQLSPR